MHERSGGYPTPADWMIAESFVHYLATKDDWSSWASEYLSELAGADPIRALRITELVLADVDDSNQIGLLGAGHVEEIVGVVGARLADGDSVPFERLKALAMENERFRKALAVAWADLDGNDPPELWDGIDKILGTTQAERHPKRDPGSPMV